MILLIDNYDSFTYNIVQYIGEQEPNIKVYRNDTISLSEIDRLSPRGIVISPGPGTPDNAGISVELVKRFYKTIPILGVCLGHQSIAQAFGGVIEKAKDIVHGKTSPIYHDSKTLFNKLDNPFKATRYHSLIVNKDSVPNCFEVSAWLKDDTIMALRHKDYPLEGVQFHPESILTDVGKTIINNFVNSINKNS